jgi:CubicO group peptidase (beta-lactamase class C family)
VTPFVAEFSTDGRSKMLDFGHAPGEDKDAIQKFEEQAIAMAEAGRFPVHLQVLHNGRVVHSKEYGNADAREF